MSRNERRARVIMLIGALLLAVAAAFVLWDLSGNDGSDSPVPVTGEVDRQPRVLNVPDDYSTIQDAVDDSGPGDLILIGPGVYLETVVVETDDIVIRGLDRNEVIIDGAFDRENGIIVFSDGVAVENLTIRNNTRNGLFFTGDFDRDIVLTGYRSSYVTAYNNGHYGIYGFNASYGLIEHSYGSGHPESAFYIGQCRPCDALVIDSIGEKNTFGYIGTNASQGLYVVDNRFVDNRVGAAPHSASHEELPPQRDSVLVGNTISNNNSQLSISSDLATHSEGIPPVGVGVWVRGGNDNLIARNRFDDNLNAAVLVAVNVDTTEWAATGNRVVDNSITGSNFDLVLVVPDGEQGSLDNCFEGNGAALTLPSDLEELAPCTAEPRPLGETVGTNGFDDLDEIDTSYTEMPVPPPQPQMPEAATAPALPSSTLERFDTFDPDEVTLPQ